MKIDKLIKIKHDKIIEIANLHGAVNIRLFGSVARGESNKSSDVDFLVEMEKGSSLIDIIAIQQDLEDLLGIKVDVVTIASISPYMRDDILKEAVNL